MKYAILIAVFITSLTDIVYGQTISLAEDGHGFIPGAYYKDTHNDFDKYVGKWQYINGSTSLIIDFRKRTHHFSVADNNYYDMLAGEYIYVENGQLTANTMSNLENTNLDFTQYSLTSIYIDHNSVPSGCVDCARKISADYVMPDRDNLNQYFDMTYYTDGPEKYIRIVHRGKLSIGRANTPTDPIIPEGTFILEKIGN